MTNKFESQNKAFRTNLQKKLHKTVFNAKSSYSIIKYHPSKLLKMLVTKKLVYLLSFQIFMWSSFKSDTFACAPNFFASEIAKGVITLLLHP